MPIFHLIRAISDEEVQRLTGSSHVSGSVSPVPEDKLQAWYSTRNQQTDRLDLMIVDRATNRCVGEVVLNDWDAENESCNFRILIGPDGRDRGLGTEAT